MGILLKHWVTGVASGGINWSSFWLTRKPSDLIVTGMRDTEIDFSWTDNSAGEASFKVYKSTDGLTYAADGTTVAGDTTYTATGLTAGNLYYFYVVGVKSGNESTPTNIYDTHFKITVDTTKAGSANNTFVFPLMKSAGVTYNCFINWGDGSAEENISGSNLDPVQHVYASSGVYQIKVRGTLPRIYSNTAQDRLKVMYLDNWGNIKWTSMQLAFYQFNNMQGRYIDVPNLTAANFNCYYMFAGDALFNSPIKFNTSTVSGMEGMLINCLAFKQSLASLNIANVVSMTQMMSGCDINATGTTTNYDATLVAWAAQAVKPSLNFHAGTSKYSAAGGGTAARAVLTGAPNSWTITDGGEL